MSRSNFNWPLRTEVPDQELVYGWWPWKHRRAFPWAELVHTLTNTNLKHTRIHKKWPCCLLWFLIKIIILILNFSFHSCTMLWFLCYSRKRKKKKDLYQVHRFSTDGMHLCESVSVVCAFSMCTFFTSCICDSPLCFTVSGVLAVGACGWQEVLIKSFFTLWTFQRGCGQKMAANYSSRM